MERTNKRYQVELTNSAKKDLKKLRSHRDQIAEVLGQLEVNPLAGHPLQGTLAELRSLVFTVKGSGAFRAIYAVFDEETVCLVIIVGPRENIYDEAERRVRAFARQAKSEVIRVRWRPHLHIGRQPAALRDSRTKHPSCHVFR